MRTSIMISAIQALVSGVIIAWMVRILIVPFKWEAQTKSRILYCTMAGVGAFMFVYYQWLMPQ